MKDILVVPCNLLVENMASIHSVEDLANPN